MKRSVLWGILVAVAAGILGYAYWWDHERRLKADIEELSKSGRVGNYTGSFDFVCFSPSTTRYEQEFYEAIKLAGQDISKSLNACGIRGACCNLDSNYSAVGLIKNGKIRCLEARFLFIPEDDRTFCARPSELQVTLETFEAPERFSGRPWIGKPGMQFYRIRRGKKLLMLDPALDSKPCAITSTSGSARCGRAPASAS